MSKLLDKDGRPTKTGRSEPVVTDEVKAWSQLIAWLRMKDYTPDMVRATIVDYEKTEAECTGSE